VDIRRQDSGGLAHNGNRGSFYARNLKEDDRCVFLLFPIAFDMAHYRHNFGHSAQYIIIPKFDQADVKVMRSISRSPTDLGSAILRDSDTLNGYLALPKKIF
jgi:hypothetical protein